MKQNETKKSQKVAEIFECEYCDYSTCRQGDFTKHISTRKHKMKQNETKKSQKVADWPETYQCICGTTFNSRTTLWRHKNKCGFGTTSDKDLIMTLVKQNSDLMEILKNGTNNITNTNCMNNNKTFNLQFFLNETCKDAMNINDFVESIKIQLGDLEKLGDVGYVEGLSNIITTNLKALDVTERPVHCTDKKRETFYIKDENKWERDDDNRSKLRKAIKYITCKNYKLLPAYREKYKGCQYSDSKYSDKYNKLVIEAMGGEGDNVPEKENKIIRNISKSVIIDK